MSYRSNRGFKTWIARETWRSITTKGRRRYLPLVGILGIGALGVTSAQYLGRKAHKAYQARKGYKKDLKEKTQEEMYMQPIADVQQDKDVEEISETKGEVIEDFKPYYDHIFLTDIEGYLQLNQVPLKLAKPSNFHEIPKEQAYLKLKLGKDEMYLKEDGIYIGQNNILTDSFIDTLNELRKRSYKSQEKGLLVILETYIKEGIVNY